MLDCAIALETSNFALVATLFQALSFLLLSLKSLDSLSNMAGYSLMNYIVLRSILFIATIKLGRHFHYLYLALIRQNVSRAKNRHRFDCKQWQTVYDCISIWFFPCFNVVNRRKQDVKIEIFLSQGGHRRLVGDERKRCFHLRKLSLQAIKPS